jgi:hypothetical protein
MLTEFADRGGGKRRDLGGLHTIGIRSRHDVVFRIGKNHDCVMVGEFGNGVNYNVIFIVFVIGDGEAIRRLGH